MFRNDIASWENAWWRPRGMMVFAGNSSKRLIQRLFLALFIGHLGWGDLASRARADRFGDIAITPQSVFSGITRRGYYEHQLLVSNNSPKRSHDVTIVFPSSSVNAPGFLLRSLKRSMSVGPNSTVLFKMWQPAFQTLDKQYSIYVDGEYQGTMSSNSYNDHGRSNPGPAYSPEAQSLLTSRNVNSDQVRNLLSDLAGVPFSAAKATGAPNASGNPAEAWKPTLLRGSSEWLELEYDPPFRASQVVIHESGQFGAVESIQVIGVDGSTLFETRTITRAVVSSGESQVHFPLTAQSVAKVKLVLSARFRGTAPGIDAVQLVGPDRQDYAVRARASSTMPAPGTRKPSSPVGLSSLSANVEFVRSELEASQWSDQWLFYTPFDAVLITSRDYEAMPEPVRSALWGYVECGGRLAVLGNIPIPLPWGKHGSREVAATTFPVGFGLCQLCQVSDLEKAAPDHLQGLARLLNPSARMLEGAGDSSRARPRSDFQVVDQVQIPFRGLAMILLGFVTVAGPLNLWLLTRYRRRIWALWTIPVISLVTCGLVSLYAVVGEGITPRLRLEGVTLLDQARHRAATRGMAGYYCPFTPSEGLLFDYNTELSWMAEESLGRERKLVDVDWTQGQQLKRGWIAPRVATYFQLRKFQSRRERLRLEPGPGGQLAVINGLGAPVLSLRLTHFDGRAFIATNLLAGQRQLLEPMAPGQPRLESPSEPSMDTNRFGLLQTLRRLNYSAPSQAIWEEWQDWQPPPGSYLALLSDAPFLEEGLKQETIRRKAQVVVGLMDPSDVAP